MAEFNIDYLIINEFTKSTEEYLESLDLYSLFSALSLIKNVILLNIAANNSLLIRTSKSYKLREGRDNESDIIKQEKMLLFEAYEIIQIIRERLTGKKLNYRLFITSEGGEGVSPTAQYIDIESGADLFLYLGLNSKEISITASKVSAEIKNINTSNNYQRNWFETKYATVLSQFRHPYNGEAKETFFVIKIPTSLPDPPLPRKKKNGSNVVYTRGHIIEALDSVYRQYYSPLTGDGRADSELITLFGQELGYDSVSGFKGGDNAMTLIKANSARLMRYTSIMNAINNMLKIYDLIANPGKQGLIKSLIYDKINKMYSNSRAKNGINKVTDEMIDKFIDLLLKDIEVH